MTNLSTYLDSSSFTAPEHVNAFRDLINTAQTKITFWGARVVEVPGYRSSIHLGNLVMRVSSMQNILMATGLTGSTINTQKEIINRIISFYSSSDEQLRNTNFFSRTLNKIREYAQHFILGIILGKFYSTKPVEREFLTEMSMRTGNTSRLLVALSVISQLTPDDPQVANLRNDYHF